MSQAEIEVSVDEEAPRNFAERSGDWNPLHTNAENAKGTHYRKPVLQGAFLGGLVSRMAGMHLPGEECLLHSLQPRFLAPIIPPATLAVSGRVVGDNGAVGRVAVIITDSNSGTRHAEATYEFGRHVHRAPADTQVTRSPEIADGRDDTPVLVTGATGALGSAVVARLGSVAVGLSRQPGDGLVHVPNLEKADDAPLPKSIAGIVHCAWPAPDNQSLTQMVHAEASVGHYLASPVRQIIALARLLVDRGTSDAALILVGSTAADPGRHNYRMPLYSLGDGLIPTLMRILTVELAPTGRRCLAVSFEVLDGGMNEGASPRARVMNKDRSPFGVIPTLDAAADQIQWVLENRSFLASGATIDPTGGAIL